MYSQLEGQKETLLWWQSEIDNLFCLWVWWESAQHMYSQHMTVIVVINVVGCQKQNITPSKWHFLWPVTPSIERLSISVPFDCPTSMVLPAFKKKNALHSTSLANLGAIGTSKIVHPKCAIGPLHHITFRNQMLFRWSLGTQRCTMGLATWAGQHGTASENHGVGRVFVAVKFWDPRLKNKASGRLPTSRSASGNYRPEKSCVRHCWGPEGWAQPKCFSKLFCLFSH